MPKQIELLFARGFRGVERGVLRDQRLQLPIMLPIFLELRLPRARTNRASSTASRARAAIGDRAAREDRRVRSPRFFRIDNVVGEPLMNCRFVPLATEKVRLIIRSSSHGSIPASTSCGFSFCRLASAKNCFDRAKIGPGANQRFVRAFAQQELQRADDDRFARAGFASDGDKPRRHLPLELFHEREIFDSQQSENGGHWES